jgi:hypothetical protein
MTTRRLALAASLLALGAAARAADDATIAAPPALKVDAPKDGSQWSHSGRLGAFYNSVSTEDAQASRDSTISSSHESACWLLTGDLSLLWREDHQSADQNLRLRYGKIRVEGQKWVENTDEIHYDGVFREEFAKPHFVYGAWGGDTVFTSPIDMKPLDPITGKVSAGYGQIYDGVFIAGGEDPKDPAVGRDRFEARIGARAQKRWSRHDPESQLKVETGPEGFARYDRPIHPVLRWFLQYEVFSEFNDIHHISQLVTAGLTAQLSKYLTAELGFRAYRESHPKEISAGSPGYDLWGMRQDTLLGVTYSF